MVVDAVLAVVEKSGDQYRIDVDSIKVEKKPGGSICDTKFVHGIVLDKEVVNGGMPKRIENARIAVINSPLEI
jgi:archaeal chaperonin